MKFEDITALHDEVRAFVEKEYPDFKVKKIRGASTTEYMPPPMSLTDDPLKLEWHLIEVLTDFRVEMAGFSKILGLDLEVSVLADGRLVIAGATASQVYMRRRGL